MKIFVKHDWKNTAAGMQLSGVKNQFKTLQEAEEWAKEIENKPGVSNVSVEVSWDKDKEE